MPNKSKNKGEEIQKNSIQRRKYVFNYWKQTQSKSSYRFGYYHKKYSDYLNEQYAQMVKDFFFHGHKFNLELSDKHFYS